MKQVARRSRDGTITVVDAPAPAVEPGWLLIANRYSLISAGTERSKIELDGKNLLQKARARPDLVKKVAARARAEGVRPALTAARDRLDALAPLGYSSAGVVIEVGEGVTGLVTGTRVACGGAGFANHAEVIAVPRNLVAAVPDAVPMTSAAYATVGAISLHGVRRAKAQVGERVGVIGLGLVGQLAVRILRAAGCEAIGIDIDPQATQLAEAGGARAFSRATEGLEETVLDISDGLGLDAVLICAATASTDPVTLATALVRERGRLVIVGDVPIEADRSLFYEKELELRLSRSYGPGRYDRDYEERGRDLPAGYVRWTEQRNMQAFLELIAAGQVDPAPLTSACFPVEDATEAYAALSASSDGERSFGILLEYSGEHPAPTRTKSSARTSAGLGRVGFIGAGSFARATLLPAFRNEGAELVAVATERGLTAADVADRFGFGRAATADEILHDESIDAVVIATRHGSHAQLVAAALQANKAVFVEKPLALDEAELGTVLAALGPDSTLMVGFNRRFAPLAKQLRRELETVSRPVLSARVNAGPLPADHWLHDLQDGGGRILGEACHFVDLLSHLADAPVSVVHAEAVPHPVRPLECSDEVIVSFRFANGAVGTLLYSGGGDPGLPKERIEAFGGGLAAVLDDFRRLEIHRDGKKQVSKGRQDKGHRAEVARFLGAVRGEIEAPSVHSYLDSTRATLAAVQSLRTGDVVRLP